MGLVYPNGFGFFTIAGINTLGQMSTMARKLQASGSSVHQGCGDSYFVTGFYSVGLLFTVEQVFVATAGFILWVEWTECLFRARA